MATNMVHVMTLANSIIGVSVLAMPFCFKQCGIMLSILVLLLSGVMTRLACHYLLKSAINARRRNFEILAFHTFGPTGKLIVELSIIGFMLGTCIAYFVVMGDLGPAIIGPIFNVDSTPSLRPSVLMGLGLLVVLPLGLLKNVDSLSTICTATIAFYLCLVLKVMAEATTHLLSWDWVDKVNLWRPAGISQCIPIFSMALSCQTQLFEVFDSVPNTPLDKMNAVIRSAVNMCTGVYISVGFFGYIAFCTQNFSGNLLMSFSPTIMSEIVKVGFVLSVAVSFPLVIFPCRASLYSLLFRRGHTPHHELLSGGGNYIPEPRFKCLTVCIVMVSLGTGLLIPSIEVVLGLVGSTIGIIICIIFPALTFICLSNKKNNERLLAQIMIGIGLFVMVLGTYSNLYATEEAISKLEAPIQGVPPALDQPDSLQLPDDHAIIAQGKSDDGLVGGVPEMKETKDVLLEIQKVIDANNPDVVDPDKRKEPPIPVEPGDNIVKEGNAKLSSAVIKMKEELEKSNLVKENDGQKTLEKMEEIKEERILEDSFKKDELNEDKLRKVDMVNRVSLSKSPNVEERRNSDLNEMKKPKRDREDVLRIMAKTSNVGKTLEKNSAPQESINIEKNKADFNPSNGETIRLESPKQNEDKKDKLKSQQNENENVKIPDIETGNKKLSSKVEQFDLSPNLTKNIIKGVPLPLAVRNNIDKSSTKPEKSVLDVGNDKQKIGGARDILSEKDKFEKEEREKRDLAMVEKDVDNIENDVDGVNAINEKSAVDVIEGVNEEVQHDVEKLSKLGAEIPSELENVPLSGTLHLDTLDSAAKCSKESKVKLENNENGFQEDISKLEQKPIPEGSRNDLKAPVTEKQIPNTSVEPLIKTPKYMSPPESVLNSAEIKPEEMIRSIQDVKPMSRDLKSVSNDQANAKNTRQEDRISEIT